MGRIVSTDPAFSLGFIAGTAGGTITANDLLVNTEFGTLISADSTVAPSALNNTTAGITASLSRSTILSSSSYQFPDLARGCFCKGTATLSNGSYVVAYTGNGTTSTQTSRFYLYSSTGSALVSNSTIESSTIQSDNFQVWPIGNNRWVFVGSRSTTGYFRIYNNDGSAYAAAVTYANATLNSSGGSSQQASLALANGNFAIAWATATNGLQYAIYDSTGAVVKAATQIVAGTGNDYFPAMALQDNGEFIVSWYVSGTGYSFARFAQDGTQQGTNTTLQASTTSPSGGQYADNITGRIFTLSNGNFLVYTNDNSKGIYYIRSSSGSAVGTITLSVNQFTYAQPMCRTSSGFAMLYAGTYGTQTTSNTVSLYDNSGNLIRTISFTGSGASPTGQVYFGGSIISRGAGGFAIHSIFLDGVTPAYWARLISIDAAGSTLGSAVALQSGGNNSVACSGSWISASGLWYSVDRSGASNTLSHQIYDSQRRSIFGVAATSATAGQTVNALTYGAYGINQNYVGSTSSDQRSAAVPGAKIVVIGNRVLASGLLT